MMPEADAARSTATQDRRLGHRRRAPGASRRLGGSVVASLALHAAAFAGMAAALAWRTAPVAPPSEAALQVVWLDARPVVAPPADAPPVEAPEPPSRDASPAAAPAGEAAVEGLEPEDALATMLPDPSPLPSSAAPLPPAEPPLPPYVPTPTGEAVAEAPASLPDEAEASLAPDPKTPPPDEAPTEAGAPAAPAPEAETLAALGDRTTAMAALSVPPPPPSPPSPPPPPRATDIPTAPTPPERRERPLRRQPKTESGTIPPARSGPRDAPRTDAFVPAPPVPPAEAPFVSGPPRFRRPPAPPDYPAQARDRGEEGTVGLRLLIGADGATREVRVHRSSGNRLFDEAALVAARRWEIEPPGVGGRRVDAWIEVPVRFRLEQ